MIRERALKVALVVVGLFFASNVYWVLILREETLQMMLSIYATLGIFLLLAARNPSANRSLIAFTAWSSIAHAAVMGVQSPYDMAERMHLTIGHNRIWSDRDGAGSRARKVEVGQVQAPDGNRIGGISKLRLAQFVNPCRFVESLFSPNRHGCRTSQLPVSIAYLPSIETWAD